MNTMRPASRYITTKFSRAKNKKQILKAAGKNKTKHTFCAAEE